MKTSKHAHAQDPKQPKISKRQRMFPERKLIYEDGEIIVRPLPFFRIPEFIEKSGEVWDKLVDTEQSSIDLASIITDLGDFLNDCVTVSGDDAKRFTDLGGKTLYDILEVWIDVNLPFFGDWRPLWELLMKKVGDGVPNIQEILKTSLEKSQPPS